MSRSSGHRRNVVSPCPAWPRASGPAGPAAPGGKVVHTPGKPATALPALTPTAARRPPAPRLTWSPAPARLRLPGGNSVQFLQCPFSTKTSALRGPPRRGGVGALKVRPSRPAPAPGTRGRHPTRHPAPDPAPGTRAIHRPGAVVRHPWYRCRGRVGTAPAPAAAAGRLTSARHGTRAPAGAGAGPLPSTLHGTRHPARAVYPKNPPGNTALDTVPGP